MPGNGSGRCHRSVAKHSASNGEPCLPTNGASFESSFEKSSLLPRMRAVRPVARKIRHTAVRSDPITSPQSSHLPIPSLDSLRAIPQNPISRFLAGDVVR